MHKGLIRRAAGAAIAILLLTAVPVFADTVPAAGDAIVDLPPAGPGQMVDVSVWFSLVCAGTNHAAPGSTIQLSLSGGTIPDDGAATVTGTTIGPVPADWPAVGAPCPVPTRTLLSNGPSAVSLRMPTTPGNDYEFTLMWSRLGTTGLTGFSIKTFRIDVVPNTPPVVTVPADMTVEATSAAGAAVSFSATATDAEDATPPTPSCTPASGWTFPLGVTTVTCTATDSGGLTGSRSFYVTVEDTTAPTLVGMPGDMTIRTNDPGGAILTYASPTATDAVDASPTVVCSPASGDPIAVGSTTVTCTATDDAGNPSTASFQANVVLNTAPVLTVPADKTAEATSAAGAVVSFTATATDAEDSTAPTPTCAPASGSTFPLGTTSVNCTVTDSDGLTDRGSFQVTVVDTTAPVMPNIADFELTTTDPTGTTLDYGYVSVVERVDPSPVVVCRPASGSWIPVGTTKVTCTATDFSGNQSSMSFTATVRLASSVTWTAVWGEPIGLVDGAFVVNGSRSIPVKVELFANGVERTSGHGTLSVVGCDGGAAVEVALSWDGGRWTGKLDTSWLAGAGCYRVTASLDGNAAGSFRLDLRGADPVSTPKGNKTKP
jgi:HYR domain